MIRSATRSPVCRYPGQSAWETAVAHQIRRSPPPTSARLFLYRDGYPNGVGCRLRVNFPASSTVAESMLAAAHIVAEHGATAAWFVVPVRVDPAQGVVTLSSAATQCLVSIRESHVGVHAEFLLRESPGVLLWTARPFALHGLPFLTDYLPARN